MEKTDEKISKEITKILPGSVNNFQQNVKTESEKNVISLFCVTLWLYVCPGK